MAEPMLLVYPSSPPPELVQAIELSGHSWRGIDSPMDLARHAADTAWNGAVVHGAADLDAALSLCATLRDSTQGIGPILLLVGGHQLSRLVDETARFDEFCLTPFHPVEFEARLRHLILRHANQQPSTGGQVAGLVHYEALTLNTETYQAAIAGRALELTHMEYELLRFLAASPGRVFTREALLSQVWGYDYFGGARTVDVHVRRLRAKLGEDHAGLIQTVRSVGYSFGSSSWAPES